MLCSIYRRIRPKSKDLRLKVTNSYVRYTDGSESNDQLSSIYIRIRSLPEPSPNTCRPYPHDVLSQALNHAFVFIACGCLALAERGNIMRRTPNHTFRVARRGMGPFYITVHALSLLLAPAHSRGPFGRFRRFAQTACPHSGFTTTSL